MSNDSENTSEARSNAAIGTGHTLDDWLTFVGKWSGMYMFVMPDWQIRMTLFALCFALLGSVGVRQYWRSRKSPLRAPGSKAPRGSGGSAYFREVEDRFDTTKPLNWSFVLKDVKVDQLVSLRNALTELGFSHIRSELRKGRDQKLYLMRFDEVCVHTAESYAARLVAVRSLAAREGATLCDYSADLEHAEVQPPRLPPPLWLRPLVGTMPRLGLVLFVIWVYFIVPLFYWSLRHALGYDS